MKKEPHWYPYSRTKGQDCVGRRAASSELGTGGVTRQLISLSRPHVPVPEIDGDLSRSSAGSVLVEAQDEWQVADKRYLSETTLALLNISEHSNGEPIAVPAAITA